MPNIIKKIEELLFDKDNYAYVLFDSTKKEEIHDKLLFEEPNHIALYDIDSQPHLEKVTPFIIELKKDSDFTKWVLEDCKYQEIGFFFSSPSNDINELKKHFDIFTHVQKYNDDRKFYFNFYNPISLSLWLKSMQENERLEFFMMINSIILENEFATGIKKFTLDTEGKLYIQQFNEDETDINTPLEIDNEHRGILYASSKSKPWTFSETENDVMSKITRENFLIRIFKKVWKYESIQSMYSHEELWKQFHIWAEHFIKLGIDKKYDLALFLVCISKFEEEWKKNKETVFGILNNTDDEPIARYIQIRDIVSKGNDNG